MNLFFDTELARGYKSNSQIARVLTEDWLSKNGYCPNCNCEHIQSFRNNLPVRDFFCPSCDEVFELKSKQAESVAKTVNDGAYHTMIDQVKNATAPNFFFLSYRKADYSVRQLMLVPKHFLTAEMIVARKPLKVTAQRHGHILCTLNIGLLPDSGKILLIDKANIVAQGQVRKQWQKSLFLREEKPTQKSWLVAVMRCIDELPGDRFTLAQMYVFEKYLAALFPNNRHIKDKIRQQLQLLRDQQVIEFVGRGIYRKI